MKSLLRLLPAFLFLFTLTGCGGSSSGSSSGGGTTPVSSSIAIQVSGATVTVSQGSSASATVTVTRTGTTGNVTLSLTGLPTGATATYQNPAAGNSGQITIATTGATLPGTYPLTVQATDGTYSASASLNLIITAVSQISTSYSWTSTGPLISAKSDATHNIIAVKDPSAVLYNGRWVIYASTVDSNGNYGMEYLNVAEDWSDASTATPYFLDYLPGTAPQVFYFAPQDKWYLIYQWTPQFSTNSDPTQPQNWTAPTNFFASQPSSVSSWIDFWVICDSENCYLFFCGDNGNFYRSSTPIGDFPNGFNTPVIVDSSSKFDMFEADNVYSIEGTGQYLANIECLGPQGQRYFRALWASDLGGAWTSLGDTDTFSTPFLGQDNVIFNSGVSNWTTSFSSGGLLIDGNDQTDSVNPNNLQFLYQGADPSAYANDSYGLIPWQLGLATATSK